MTRLAKLFLVVLSLSASSCASPRAPSAVPIGAIHDVNWMSDTGLLSITYPSDWTQHLDTQALLLLAAPSAPGETFVDSFSIQSEAWRPAIEIAMGLATTQNADTNPAASTRPEELELTDLNQYVKAGLEQFKDAPNLHFIDNSPAMLAGHAARRMIYEAYGRGTPWLFVQYVTLRDTKAYVLTFTFGSRAKYQKLKPAVDRMLQSLAWHEVTGVMPGGPSSQPDLQAPQPTVP